MRHLVDPLNLSTTRRHDSGQRHTGARHPGWALSDGQVDATGTYLPATAVIPRRFAYPTLNRVPRMVRGR